MHSTIDYSKSPSPQFDAVQDVMEWFGERYQTVAAEMSKVKDRDTFAFYCSFVGVGGFPVKAWYEHFHGQGSWEAGNAKG